MGDTKETEKINRAEREEKPEHPGGGVIGIYSPSFTANKWVFETKSKSRQSGERAKEKGCLEFRVLK